MPTYEPKEATTYSIHNRINIENDTKCGCYFCMRVCEGKEIDEWCDEKNDTALCPHCSIDSLLPGVEDVKFLEEAHEIFFTGIA